MGKNRINFNNGRLSFYKGDAGWRNICFEFNGILSPDLDFTMKNNSAAAESKIHRERLVFEQTTDSIMIVKRFITNITADKLAIKSISDGILDKSGSVMLNIINEYTLRYMHSSNVRSEKYPDSRPEYPLIRPVPYSLVHFNIGEANHFPAFVLCDEDFKSLLVEGDLNQTKFERSWELGLDGDGTKSKLIRTYQGQQQYLLSHGLELEPGEELEVSRVFYQILENTHPQDAYKDYIEALNEQHEFYGKKSPMRHGAVFCTWNYGTLHNITEELIIDRVQALKEKVPECTYFMIDDGYQKNRDGRNGPLDCFYPDFDCDRKKFPHGMKYVADEISEIGLIPCIWLSPTVYLDSQLAKDYPEWLLKDENGNPGILDKTTYLDVSVPEAREFFLQVLDLLFIEWGYKGIKFDFMTHWFTLGKARFANGGSGVEWRDFIFSEIRKRIGDDGLFMTCIAMSMGNPFPGLNADCYRCACDIHDGTWAEQLNACKATLPQILIEGLKTFMLNMDSAGFGDIPENEQIFRLTWIFITQGIIELGGPVENMPKKQIEMWRRMLQNIDRGNRVCCMDERAFVGDGMPEILKVEYSKDSISYKNGIYAHIAFFNWENYTKTIGREITYFDIPENASIVDFWSRKPLVTSSIISECLLPHCAKLLEITVGI